MNFSLLPLVKNEFRLLLFSPSTYAAGVLSLSLMGFLYVLTLVTVSTQPQESSPVSLFFSLFWLPALLMVPMLTMRSVADERRLGTLETLLSTPIPVSALIFAKFLAAFAIYCMVWFLSLSFPLIAGWVLDLPVRESPLLESGPMAGGLLFVFLSGSLFTAIGIFSSSLTRSQLIAGMLTFSSIFILVTGAAALRFLHVELEAFQSLPEGAISYFQLYQHFEDFSRGIYDSRPIVYYLSATALILGFARIFLDPLR